MSKLKLFYWLLPLAILVAWTPKPVFSLNASPSTDEPRIPVTSNNQQAPAQLSKTIPKTAPAASQPVPKSLPVPPVINEFKANPNTISIGGSSSMNWSVSNGTSITIEPAVGSVALLGNIKISPSSTTTYTLTATNADSCITTSITVVVTYSISPPPPPLSPPAEASVLCNDGSYSYYDHQCGCCSHQGGVKRWINKPPF
jgi:hypothetical protein